MTDHIFSNKTFHSASELRRVIRDRRHALTPQEQQRASSDLLIALKQNQDFNSAKHIACYLAVDGELDLKSVIEYCWAQQKHCYLPVIRTENQTEPKALDFYLYKEDTRLVNGAYNILIPDYSQSASDLNKIDRHNLEVVLMPLVAFDKQGHRLGMGGGYYDFSFQHLKEKQKRGTQLIALAHSCQQVDVIHSQAWDIKPDTIIAV